jgi:hypothetical protein
MKQDRKKAKNRRGSKPGFGLQSCVLIDRRQTKVYAPVVICEVLTEGAIKKSVAGHTDKCSSCEARRDKNCGTENSYYQREQGFKMDSAKMPAPKFSKNQTR